VLSTIHEDASQKWHPGKYQKEWNKPYPKPKHDGMLPLTPFDNPDVLWIICHLITIEKLSRPHPFIPSSSPLTS
jgi:hypothetical protein